MNRNNLEDLKDTLKQLKFGQELTDMMVANMEKNLSAFALKAVLSTEKGQMDLTMDFRQSGKSDFYYFNNYKLELLKSKPLSPGYQYSVTSPNPKEQGPKNLIKYFDSPIQAIAFFNGQKGTAELATAKKEGQKHVEGATIATMKEGKVDYVAKEFYGLYRNPAISNTFYLKNNSTFNLEQGVNLLEGRAVFRDDLLNRGNEQYAAWVQLDFEAKKDNYGNFQTRQFSEGYGFDLKRELQSYEIKELGNDKKLENLLAELKDGNKVLVTVSGQDGQEQKLQVVAMPRYNNLNFFEQNGKPAIRENFRKEAGLDHSQEKGKSKGQSAEKGQENALTA